MLVEPFWLRKITTDSLILTHVNIECPDDKASETKNLYPILAGYEYIPAAYVTMHCII
jgi:hypothetical protein